MIKSLGFDPENLPKLFNASFCAVEIVKSVNLFKSAVVAVVVVLDVAIFVAVAVSEAVSVAVSVAVAMSAAEAAVSVFSSSSIQQQASGSSCSRSKRLQAVKQSYGQNMLTCIVTPAVSILWTVCPILRKWWVRWRM